MSRRAVAAAGLAAVLLVGPTGCGIPEDPAVRPLDAAAIPDGLTDPTTTTSTTTTLPTTTVPSTTVPDVPTSAATVLDVLPPVAIPSDVVWLVFVSGDRFVEVPRTFDQQAGLNEVVALLAMGPDFVDPVRELRTSIESGDVVDVQLVAGVAEVELDPTFRELPSVEQRRAIVQLVLTLTGRAGVGQVRFRIGETPLPVPRSDGSFGAQTVSRDDFAGLLVTLTPAQSAAPTTSTVPTPVPAGDGVTTVTGASSTPPGTSTTLVSR